MPELVSELTTVPDRATARPRAAKAPRRARRRGGWVAGLLAAPAIAA